MTARRMLLRACMWVGVMIACSSAEAAPAAGGIEPNAGNWRTWVISSGKDYRVPPPPGPAETRAELRTLAELISHNDASTAATIAFWDAGAPSYRWIDLINARALAGHCRSRRMRIASTPMSRSRCTTRPSRRGNRSTTTGVRGPARWTTSCRPRLQVPNSPSYPSEHAAAAQAAATVLAYFFPQEAQTFQAMAEEAGWSRVLAGVQYPERLLRRARRSDRQVAEQVIAKAAGRRVGRSLERQRSHRALQLDRRRTRETSPPQNWKPLLLALAESVPSAGSAGVRLSPDVQAEARPSADFPRSVRHQLQGVLLAEPRRTEHLAVSLCGQVDVRRRPRPESAARGARLRAHRRGAVRRVHRQPGRQVHLLVHQATSSSIRRSFRCSRCRTSRATRRTTRRSPRHARRSSRICSPTRADFIRAVGKEAGDSRIWAGIHYQMDNVAGVNLGRSVAGVFIDWAKNDGSE